MGVVEVPIGAKPAGLTREGGKGWLHGGIRAVLNTRLPYTRRENICGEPRPGCPSCGRMLVELESTGTRSV